MTSFDALPSWLLGRASLRAHRVLGAELDRLGGTRYEYRVVDALAGGPLTQAEVGRAAALDRRDVNRVVTALEAAGLVRRGRSDADARVLVVELTGEGQKRGRRLHERAAAAQDVLLTSLTDTERATLVGLLTRIVTEADPPASEPDRGS